MKESYKAELEGNNLSYAEKLEEMMLNKDQAKDGEDEVKDADGKPVVIDGSLPVALNANEAAPSGNQSALQHKYLIRGHFDSVRGMHYCQSLQVIASASDDCQVKIWNIKGIQKDHEVSEGFLESYITLRGHTGPLMSITGTRLQARNPQGDNQSEGEKINRLIFTAGGEGVIRVWNIPEAVKDDKFPQTDGRNYCVGIWSDKIAEPYWQLSYHPFADLLLAIKADKYIQFWDCKDVIEKAAKYDPLDLDQCKADMSTQDSPLKEYAFEADGKSPAPTCCSWLPTDSNLFVVGYRSSHIAIFDYTTAKVENFHKFASGAEEDSEVVCMDSHELQPVIVTGHLDGNLNVFEFRQMTTLYSVQCVTEESDREKGVYIQCVKYFNNCQNIVVGLSNGNIQLYDSKAKLLNIVEKAHNQKYDEGVNCLLAIQNLSGSSKAGSGTQNLPFFVSGGADGQMKIFEHNPYQVPVAEKADAPSALVEASGKDEKKE